MLEGSKRAYGSLRMRSRTISIMMYVFFFSSDISEIAGCDGKIWRQGIDDTIRKCEMWLALIELYMI